jgi:hypothetical protein
MSIRSAWIPDRASIARQRSGGELEQLTRGSMTILPHEPDPPVPVAGDDRHRGRVVDDVQLRFLSAGEPNSILAHGEDLALEDRAA